MSFGDIGDLIVKVGIEPVILVALLYLLFRQNETVNKLTATLTQNTATVEKLVEYVKGRDAR